MVLTQRAEAVVVLDWTILSRMKKRTQSLFNLRLYFLVHCRW
ncbi:hypothetical protein [Cystobacter fuscus]